MNFKKVIIVKNMNKKTTSSILLGGLLLILVILPLAVTAQASGGDSDKVIGAVQSLFVKVGSAVIVIGWIITGILYLTAGGGERLGIAKKALIACVIGTALIIISTTAYNFVKDALSLP
jgi:hypothetical protein